jgi:hypothetical protein
MIPLSDDGITRECMVCKANTTTFRWSIMGQIKMPLCEQHKDYQPFLSFGPGFLENATMGVKKNDGGE